MTRVLPVLALLAAPAFAQEQAGQETPPLGPVETAAGLAVVKGGSVDRGPALVVGGEDVLGDLGELVDAAYVEIEREVGDLLLVSLGSGGTACPAQWVWVRAGADGPSVATDPFGTCAPEVAVTADAETVTVTMPSPDADFPLSAFTWDGRARVVAETPLPQEPSGSPPGAGAGPWVGRYPFDLFRSSDWRGPLVALMGEEGYALGQQAIASAGPMERQGDWVAGWGFDPATGGAVGGAVAINLQDGRVLVAVHGLGPDSLLWGDPGGAVPPFILEALAGPPGE